MLNPFEILHELWNTFADPSSRSAALTGIAIYAALFSPIWITGTALRRYAKSHGREIAKEDRPSGNAREPFADARLNEALGVIQRWSFPVGLAIIGLGGAASFVSDAEGYTWAAIGVGYFIIFARHLFVEACLAFGAELAPAEAASVDGVAGTA